MTWLAFQDRDGSAYPHYWEWQIIYDTNQCGTRLVDEGWIIGCQASAVLTTPRAAEAVSSAEEYFDGFGEVPDDELLQYIPLAI